MKHLLSFFLLIYFNSTYSQTNNFAPIGASWYYEDIYGIDYDDTLYISGYNKVESISDTIIEGIACRELEFSFVKPTGEMESGISRYVYEDNEKVYFLRDDQFELVYNFSGDDWYAHDIYYETDDSALIIVDSVLLEEYDGSLLKTLYVHTDFTFNLSFISNRIVEKIGPFCYMFLYNGGDDSFPPSGLRCYSDSEIDYKTNEAFECDSLTPEITDIDVALNNPIEIYYGNNELTIVGISGTTEIILLNILGQSIIQKTATENLKLNVGFIPNGNYILLLKTESNSYAQQIYFL